MPMLLARRCTRCGARWRRSECRFEPDGLFGPEWLCPRCESITDAALTPLGWAAVLAFTFALAAGVSILTW